MTGFRQHSANVVLAQELLKAVPYAFLTRLACPGEVLYHCSPAPRGKGLLGKTEKSQVRFSSHIDKDQITLPARLHSVASPLGECLL
jgi:hypothetical protein